MTNSSHEHTSEPTKGQETTIATSEMGRTVLIRHTSMGDKSEKSRKMDDKSRQEDEVDIEEQVGVTVDHSSESVGDDNFGDEPICHRI